MLLLALLVAVDAGAATVKYRARFRVGASKDTRLIGWVEPGTELTATGVVERGWHQLQTPDGVTGFVWGEHLTESSGAPPAPTTPPTTVPEADAPQTPPAIPARDEVGATLQALRERTDAMATAVNRLEQNMGKLSARLEGQRPAVPAGARTVAPGSPDISPAAALVFLVLGAAVGWALGRLAQRMRERRQKIRVRL